MRTHVVTSTLVLGMQFLCATEVLASDGPVLKAAASVMVGQTPVVLAKGTSVLVLSQRGDSDVISVTLPDGEPLITEVASSEVLLTAKPEKKNAEASLVRTDPPNVAADKGLRAIPPPSLPDAIIPAPIASPLGDKEEQLYPCFKFPPDFENSALPPSRYTALTGTFQIPMNNTFVTVVYCLPLQDDHLAKEASNLIFYGPYPGEKTELTGNIVPNLVTRLGCSVYSFQFEGLGQQVSILPYWDPKAGWFEAALQVRELLIRRFGLEHRKLILMGYSGGAGMVMNFAGAYPDQIDAVAAQAPNVVPSASLQSNIKWLLVVNRGDSNRLVMRPFCAQVRSRKGSILYCETTPDRNRGSYHAPSNQTFDLIYSYLVGIVEQRHLEDEGVTDIAHLWPYAAPSEPLHRYAISKTSDLELGDLNSTDFDLLPSMDFAFNWSRVCPPEQNIVAGSNSKHLILNFPARQQPTGVILYYAAAAYNDIPREIEDINSLAEHGFIVVSSMTTNPADFAEAATSWIKSQDKLNGVYVHLIGNGPAGAQFISQMADRSDVSFRSVSLIDFNNSAYESAPLDGVTTAAKECGMYGFFSYSTVKDDPALYTWASTLVNRGAADRGCFNVCAKMTEPPKISEPARHTAAEDDALGMIKTLIQRADNS